MSRGCDEDLRTKVVAYEFVFAHWHVLEASAIELVIDTVQVVWTTLVLVNKKDRTHHAHVFSHMSNN